jgi:hypothetical protein
MSETLADVSTVHLFGRVVTDVSLTVPAQDPQVLPHVGANSFLTNEAAVAGRRLARIYAFAYQGHYYDVSGSALFLVDGNGAAIGDPVTVERIGSAATGRTFANDVRVWAYDKSDLSMRLSVETGTLEQILLDPEISSDRLKLSFEGKSVRLRGSTGNGG